MSRDLPKLAKPTRRDAVAGLLTGLFSIPEGMAYASLGNFPASLGLWTGIAPTIVGSLLTRTVLMVTTLTSGIALTTASVLRDAGLKTNDVGAIATITVIVGVTMTLLGLLRLGSIMSFVSTAVMTGFTVGISVQIIAGIMKDATGFTPTVHNTLGKIGQVLWHFSDWQGATVSVTLATILVWAGFRLFKHTAQLATLLSLLGVTAVSAALQLDIPRGSSLAKIPSSLPPITLPELSAVPSLAVGSLAIVIVALAQAAGISAAIPNPDDSRPDTSGDFIAQGAANIAGGFFGALPSGGSLSRSGVSSTAGAQTRWAGIFAGLWLAVIVLVAGPLTGYIPMSVIAGLLIIIGSELLLGRRKQILLVARTSAYSLLAMVATFVATTALPLQLAIFVGAGLSILVSAMQIQRQERVLELRQTSDGNWTVGDPPAELPSDRTTMVHSTGVGFFAQVPRLLDGLPSIGSATDAALVISVVGSEDVPSATTLVAMERLVNKCKKRGIPLVFCGLHPSVHANLKRTGALDVIGHANVIPSTSIVGEAQRLGFQKAEAARLARKSATTEKGRVGTAKDDPKPD